MYSLNKLQTTGNVFLVPNDDRLIIPGIEWLKNLISLPKPSADRTLLANDITSQHGYTIIFNKYKTFFVFT